MVTSNLAATESIVLCQNSEGTDFRATLLRLTRYVAVFEVYNPALVIRSSEVIPDFRIVVQERTIYSGRAVIGSAVNTGSVILCEAKLQEDGFSIASFQPAGAPSLARDSFGDFLRQWQKVYRVVPEFKVVVADMQTFLADLRLWLDQVELEIRSMPTGDRVEAESRASRELGAAMVPAFNAMHERLEEVSESVEEELRPVHQNFAKRQLHPLMLCAPFAYRTFQKPLGYAGDYEMVNMIVRDPCEGASLYAKIVNTWFLRQWPAEAHRNRIGHLSQLLTAESRRVAQGGKPLRVLNLGCGPAREIQDFMTRDSGCDNVQFTLLDFNSETIDHTSRALEELRQRHGRRTRFEFQKKSVHHILKEAGKPAVTSVGNGHSGGPRYDFIYCAGLIDYLSDKTCRQLINVLSGWLAPGALLAITSVDNSKPFRHMLEFVLDWHIIYRDAKQTLSLLPGHLAGDNSHVERDVTGVNVFVESRKPSHA
jgi:extracellular factor (EF) 3-hydroxypalmitic acid methyl ester biosynthesis protein